MRGNASALLDLGAVAHAQQNQPPDVPPLELTGERTLPDVPEENYWYQRHLAVYEWIAERVRGPAGRRPRLRRGLRLRRARRAGGAGDRRRRQPRGLRARRGCATGAPTCASSAAWSSSSPSRATRSSSCRRSSTSQDPDRLLSRFAELAPVSYVSTPNRLTLAPPGAEKSDNPWHLREYTIEEYRELLEPCFSRVEVLGLFHARKLRAHELAICASAGTASTRRCASPSPSTTASSRRSPPPTSPCATETSSGRWTSSPSAMREPVRRPGDRPAQPHALRRGLRHLPLRRGVAVRRGDPLLPAGAGGRPRPDDDGDAGARRPARGPGRARAAAPTSWSTTGSARRRPTSQRCRRSAAPAVEAEAGALPGRPGAARRLRRRPALRIRGGARRGPGRADGLRGDPRRAAAAGHPAPGCGCSSTPASPRTGGASAGTAASGCPSAPTSPGSSGSSPSTGSPQFCVDQSAHEAAARRAGAGGNRGRPGRLHDRLGGDLLALVAGRLSQPPRVPRSSTASRCAGCGSGGSAAAPMTRPPRSGPQGARRTSSSPRRSRSCAAAGRERGRRGLLVFAIDTELIGHWWSEGPIWLAEVLDAAPAAGPAAADPPAGPRRARARAAAARRLELGRGQGLPHLGLAGGGRPRLGRAPQRAAPAAGAGRGPQREPRERALRASCSRCRRATGPSSTAAGRPATTRFTRATDHAQAMLEAIDSSAPARPAHASPGT